MIKRILILAALAAALLSVTPSSAESICADAGATGLVPARAASIHVPVVCIPVP